MACQISFIENSQNSNYPQYFSGFSRALFPKTFLEIAVCLKRTVLSTRVSFSFLAVITDEKALNSLIKCSFVQAQVAKVLLVMLKMLRVSGS